MQSQYPEIAGLASQMEMFTMSKREIEAKFTRSEMVLLAWRSQELSYQMEQKTKGIGGGSQGATSGKRRNNYAGQLPDDLPDHFFNADGELDLRQVTGKEAHKLLSSMGIILPVIQR
jgi:hypothetical protein